VLDTDESFPREEERVYEAGEGQTVAAYALVALRHVE
jgi:hypothetical protein